MHIKNVSGGWKLPILNTSNLIEQDYREISLFIVDVTF